MQNLITYLFLLIFLLGVVTAFHKLLTWPVKQCIPADVRDCFLNNLVLQDAITITLNHSVLHTIF